MELLSRFTSRTVAFLLYHHGKYTFEIVAHGLEKDIGLSWKQMEDELNSGVFYKRLLNATESSLWTNAQECVKNKESYTTEFDMKSVSGDTLSMIFDVDYVDDELGDVRCILSLRKK